MDFIILKINGHDVSDCSHEEAVRHFNSAPDRFIVEIARKSSESDINLSNTNNHMSTASIAMTTAPSLTLPFDFTSLTSITTTQLDSCSQSTSRETQDSIRKVRMTRTSTTDTYGLTLSYELMTPQCSESNLGPITSVFISEIETGSVADQLGELDVGDEIIAINDEIVMSRDHVIELFQKSKLFIDITIVKCSDKDRMHQFDDDDDDDEDDEEEIEVTETQLQDASNFLTNLRETDIISSYSSSSSTSSMSTQSKSNTKNINTMYPENIIEEDTEINKSIIKSNMNHIETMIHELTQTYSALMTTSSDMSHTTVKNDSSTVRSHLINESPISKVESSISRTVDNRSRAISHSPTLTKINKSQVDGSPIVKRQNNESSVNQIMGKSQLDDSPMNTIDLLKDMPVRQRSFRGIQESVPTLHTHDPSKVPLVTFQDCNQNRSTQRTSSRPSYSSLTDSPRKISDTNESNNRIYANLPVTMEWVIKKRADGSRYITRRPKRNQILRERARQLIAERTTGITTDDDVRSERKLGKYWTKSERRRHLRKYRRMREAATNMTTINPSNITSNSTEETSVRTVISDLHNNMLIF